MFESNASSGTDWAGHELAHAQLPDSRLVRRLTMIATDFAQRPTAPIPQACGAWGRTKAAYRFFDNEGVQPEVILAAHVQATVQRMEAHRLVLCVQDTTALNYSSHPHTQGLGPIAHNRDKTLGLFLHSTLALSTTGQSLGLLQAQTWARSGRHFGRSSHQRNRTPRAQKESQKWMESLSACQRLAAQCVGTTLINVADREGDLYDLFQQALAPSAAPRVHLLVRAQHDRQVAHPQKYLWDLLAAQRPQARLQVQVPRKEGQPGRLATLAIRFTPVTLRPPCLKQDQPSISLWAVEAREERAPKGAKAICWRLLTTLEVTTAQAAIQKVRWYALRWQIEILHKVLKSGCQVQQRQLETTARLRRVLMVDLLVAWRVLSLCQAARQTPQAPVSDWLSGQEWRALWCYYHQKPRAPRRAPSLRQALRWIAQLGGFLARRRDGEPGPIVVWRGLHELQTLTTAWRRFGHD
jgi:hypothetical protein